MMSNPRITAVVLTFFCFFLNGLVLSLLSLLCSVFLVRSCKRRAMLVALEVDIYLCMTRLFEQVVFDG